MARRTRLLALVCLGFCLTAALIGSSPALAQAPTAPGAVLSLLQANEFPRITAYLNVHDAQGSFVEDLQTSNLRILEDGVEVPALVMSQLQPGARLVVAVAPGPTFAIRDNAGTGRYDYLVQALSQWAESSQAARQDELSLVAAGVTETLAAASPVAWVQALLAYQPALRQAMPSLAPLARAMEVATAEVSHPGMGRAILFITPPQADAGIGLQSLLLRAKQAGVRISIWFVASPDLFNSTSALQLQELAVQSGGQFFTFSGVEPIPSPEDLLIPLRSIYRLAYESQAKTSGAHQVTVEVTLPDSVVTTPALTYDLAIQPPTASFVAPPSQVVRSLSAASQATPAATPVYTPLEQVLTIRVDFPDQITRPISTTLFYVDGALVARQLRPPFDKFTWDLSGYQTTAVHVLRVEVVDSLGLVGASETQVEVQVEEPAKSFVSNITGRITLLAALVVTLAGAVLGLVLVLGGRLRPRVFGQPAHAAAPSRWHWGRRAKADPLTQPVEVKDEAPQRRLPQWVNRFHWPQRQPAPVQAFAYLTTFSDKLETSARALPMPIGADEVTFGRDPTQATWVLDDPSVDALHARLVREGETYRLADQGSIAGTWINYTPVSKEGALLEHGDIIHIGRSGFRFTFREPTRIRKPVVITSQDKLP
jgi:hypothetical protein